MNKLTFPEFQNPHTFLTSMTPSGSIPSGPPCSLQTKKTAVRQHPFPKPPNCTLGGQPFTTCQVRLPSPARVPFRLREQRKLREQSTQFIYCAPAQRLRTGNRRKSSVDAGAPVSAAGRLARAPHAQLRPLQCASRVIDAGKGLARAMPTVHPDPVAGPFSAHLRAASNGRCRPPPAPLKH